MKKVIINKSREDLLREAAAKKADRKSYAPKGYINSIGKRLLIVKPGGYVKIARSERDAKRSINKV